MQRAFQAVEAESDAPFLNGGGQMGALIRALDWGRTPLGPPSRWTAPLRLALRLMLSSNHPVFVFWGPEFRCFYNDACSRSLGPEKHPSILGQPGHVAFAEAWPQIGPELELVISGKDSVWHEDRLVPILRGGRIENGYWTYSFSPIDDESAPTGAGGVLMLANETTAQVETARTLEAAPSSWREMFAQAPGFVAIMRGEQHVFEFCNQAYFELVGRDDLVGLTVRQALPWAAEQGFLELLDRVYRSGRAHSGHAQPITVAAAAEPGQLRYVDFVFQPIRDEHGEVNGIFVLGSDVTEQKATQEALLASERRLRIASDAAAIGIFELDVESGLIEWDARTRAIWGAADRESVGMAEMTAAVHPQDREAKAAATARALDPAGTGHYRTEYRVQNAADGRVRWVQAHGQAVFEGGRATRLVGAVQDISERKLADSRREEFLATLGHELRNPLAPIGNALQMLHRQGGHGVVADNAIGVIDRQFHHVVRLIDDLLDVVRIQHGKFELRKARVGLHEVLEQAFETAAPAIERGGHRIDRRLPDAPVWLDVDPVRMAQVVSNLLINACKYSDAGSTIDVSAERSAANELQLRVRDRGIGIEADYIDRVFDTFSQAEPSLHRSHGGLGIGLALARGIVELHGGRISARSPGRNLGSVFEVALPLAQQRSEVTPRMPASRPVPETAGDPQVDDRLAGQRLLLVEDNHDHAETLSVLLGLYGASVRWAPDGPAALDAAEDQRPQTVLLDLGLPGLNGYEVCRRLRATSWGRTMQIIALTGWGQPSDRERTRRAGFDAHLLKPVDFDALLRLLSH